MPVSDRARLTVTVRLWRGPDDPGRVPAPFRASWIAALSDLESEVALRDWDALVVRTPNPPESPGIVVEVAGLTLTCDRYADGPGCRGMTANLRAITRTLTAFRQIERDGVSVSGQVADCPSPEALLPS